MKVNQVNEESAYSPSDGAGTRNALDAVFKADHSTG